MVKDMKIPRQKKRVDDIFNDTMENFLKLAEERSADTRRAEINKMFVEEFREAVSGLFAILKTRCNVEDIWSCIKFGNGDVEYMSLSFCGENRAELFRIENNTTMTFELTDYIRGKKVKGEIERIIRHILDETD